MKKEYLSKYMLFLALVVAVVSCSKDNWVSPEEGVKNAEKVLGVTIDPLQDWKMATQVTGDITVTLGLSQSYTVAVYDVNPLNNPDATYYVRKTVREGEKTSFTCSLPTAVKMVYAVIFDNYKRSLVKQVPVIEGTLSIDFGSSSQTRSSFVSLTRSILPDHDFSSDIPAKPTTAEMDNADNFGATPPAGVKSYYERCRESATQWYTPTEFTGGSAYIDASFRGEVRIHKGNAENRLYVMGNCNFTQRSFYLGEGFEVYLLEGASLTLSNGFSGNTKVYLSNGSRLTVNNNISTGNVSYYSKGGSITARSGMVVNGQNELFMEGGSLTVNGLFQLQPANCYLHNTTVAIHGQMDMNQGWDGSLNRNVPAVYYQEGGTFDNTGKELVCNSGKFYIDVDSRFSSIAANGSGVIVNKGHMTSDGDIKVYNNNSVLINDGDLSGAYLGTEGSSHFQNNGNVVIDGSTVVNSNNNTWVNNGQYQTGYFIYNAGSSQVINNCHMVVDEDFNINLGDNAGTSTFIMDSNSCVETQNFNGGKYSYTYFRTDWNTYVTQDFGGGPFRIDMGSESVFKVSGTATMCATKDGYGIYGPEEGNYAVFEANEVVAGKEGQGFLVTYGNNLVVSSGSHFAQGHDGDPTHPFIHFIGSASLYDGDNTPAIQISAQEPCNPGFNPGTPSSPPSDDDIPGSPAVWTFAFEDTFNGDYDMNDVVLQVKENEDDDSMIDVTLCCTGASFNLYVFLRTDDGRDLRMFNGREVHAVLGQPSGKFINTGEGDSDKFISNIDPVTFTFAKPSSNFDIATADFWIQSPQGDIHVGTTYGAGSAPYGLVIPKAWRWPKEWNTITGNSVTDSPYPDFAGFAADRTVNTTWYDNVVEDLVY